MNIKTPHKTDDDAKRADAPPAFDEGQYEAVVVSAEEQVSQAGNPMIALQLTVYHEDGRQKKQRDWLLEKFAFKLRHFVVAAGLEEQYMQGNLDADACRDVHVLVDLEVEDNKKYGPQNKVVDYWPWTGEARSKPSGSAVGGYDAPEIDDKDLPF